MKVFKRDNVAMNVLRQMGYSNVQIAKMFDVSSSAVTYATNDKYRENKRDYQREYERQQRANERADKIFR